jgi:AraC-like DNA-binding protein
MSSFANNYAAKAEAIGLRHGSGSAETEMDASGSGNCFKDEVFRLALVKSTNRAQLKAAQRIDVSLRYMMRHLNQPMKVSVLSAMAGLSESSFFVLFKSATGLTPLDFFIRARMRRAGELLEETTLKIKEIAATLGYDDQFYFSRLFKLVHGVPPREYRAGKHDEPQKPESAYTPSSVSDATSPLPGWIAADQNQSGARVAIGAFQPAMRRAKTYGKKCRDPLPKISQTRPISIR